MIYTLLGTFVFLYPLAILFIFPSREVTQPPGRIQILRELFLPGTAPIWNLLGGLILVAWCYLVIQDLLILKTGSPYILAAIAFPNVGNAYGVPMPGNAEEFIRTFLRPSWIWIYLAPAVLFVSNLVLVLLSRRRA